MPFEEILWVGYMDELYSAAGYMINVVSQPYTLNKVSFTETQTKQSYILSS